MSSSRDIGPSSHNRKLANISYNPVMNTTTIAICPRRSEGALWLDDILHTKPESEELASNDTTLSGTLIFNNEGDWNQLL